MIYLIKGAVFDDALQVQELHHEYPVLVQHLANPFGHRVQLLQVEKHTRRVDDVKLPAEPARHVSIEERVNRGNPGLVGNLSGGPR